MSTRLYNQDREYFLSFLARTSQKQRTLEHLLQFLPVYCPQLMTSIEEGSEARILDIGPGTGRLSIPLVSHLGGRIDFTAREPSLGMALNFFFKYLVQGLPYQALTIDPRANVDYGKEQNDFVLASHSFYYLSDWENAVDAVYESIVPGGAACLIVSSPSSPLFKLRAKFFPILYSFMPKSAAELEDIIRKKGLKYEAGTISSGINLSPLFENDVDTLRKEGILEPRLEALYSFILRGDYTQLPLDLKKSFDTCVAESRRPTGSFPLVDTALWIIKPGSVAHRPAIRDYNPKKFTLANFLDIFRPMLEAEFGNDLEFLPAGLKETYYLALALNAVLTHPIHCAVMIDGLNYQRLIDEDEDLHMLPIAGRQMKDFVIHQPTVSLAPGISTSLDYSYLGQSRGWEFLLFYTHSSSTLDYLLNHILQEHDFLGEEDKAIVDRSELLKLMLTIFRKFNHDQIFSNRFDNSSLIRILLRSDFFDVAKLRTHEKITPELARVYANLQLTPSQQHPIKS